MQTIVIVDDHQMVAKALMDLLDKFKDYKVLYHVTNGIELIEQLKDKNKIPQLVLLDINMPEMNGFATMKYLHENYPEVKVLVLSMNDDGDSYHQMVANGANGFISKMATADELQKAITQVITKGYYYTIDMADAMFRILNKKNVAATVLLSEREKQLLSFIGTELTYQEIADQMHLSAKTIDGYRNGLFQKLNIKSRTGLAMFAVKEGYYKI